MKIKSAEFDRSAPNLEECPNSPFPEFAFIGRSNVGKSSIINLLTERNALAKVSVTPGKTKLINFFRINGSWNLVDLPGYGYANVSKDQRADFNEAVADYTEKREKLRLMFVLIDARLEPQKIDLGFLAWLEGTGKPYALIFTKTDKLSSSKVEANVALFVKTAFAGRTGLPRMFRSSAKTKAGRLEILQFIAEMLAERK
jgi:GTP-binding protein